MLLRPPLPPLLLPVPRESWIVLYRLCFFLNFCHGKLLSNEPINKGRVLVCLFFFSMVKFYPITFAYGNQWKCLASWWFQIFLFTPKIGEDFQFDEHIFQMGWFNHQPEILGVSIDLLLLFGSESASSSFKQHLEDLEKTGPEAFQNGIDLMSLSISFKKK